MTMGPGGSGSGSGPAARRRAVIGGGGGGGADDAGSSATQMMQKEIEDAHEGSRSQAPHRRVPRCSTATTRRSTA